jgi:hypothetical protein
MRHRTCYRAPLPAMLNGQPGDMGRRIGAKVFRIPATSLAQLFLPAWSAAERRTDGRGSAGDNSSIPHGSGSDYHHQVECREQVDLHDCHQQQEVKIIS